MPRVFASYTDFIERGVKPLLAAHPGRLRLNGQEKGSDLTVWACFDHAGAKYKVHADSRITCLLRPFEHWVQGLTAEPLILGIGKKGNPKLKPYDGDDRGFYVYPC